MIINCIVQARMGSKRFPGKVMAEVAGKPLIGHLLDSIMGANVDKIIVAIPRDDEFGPLGYYLYNLQWVHIGVGDEINVAGRFCEVLKNYPCDAFIRVCADSPLINALRIDTVVVGLQKGSDFVHHSGQSGQQVQGITKDLFLKYVDQFDEYDHEHVLSFFTRHTSMSVDTPGDLERVRPLISGEMTVSDWMKRPWPPLN